MSKLINQYRDTIETIKFLIFIAIAMPLLFVVGWVVNPPESTEFIMSLSLVGFLSGICLITAHYKNNVRKVLKEWIMNNPSLRRYIER